MKILLLVTATVFSQELTSPQTHALRVGDPQLAVRALKSDSSEVVDFLRVEQTLRTGAASNASALARAFENRWPLSSLLPRVQLLQAWAGMVGPERKTALDQWLGLLQTHDKPIADLASGSLRQWSDSGRLDPVELVRVAASTEDDSLIASVRAAFARRQGASPEGPIAILLPTTGDFAAIAKRMAKGAQLAAAARSSEILQLEEPALPLDVVAIVRGLNRVTTPRGLVGPLLSEAAALVALELARTSPELRIVLPAATRPGIAKLHPNAWQLNITTAAQGVAAARMLSTCSDSKEAFLVYPKGEYGEAVAEGFRNEFRRRGGRVLLAQAYPSGRSDFRGNLEAIRRSWKEALRSRHADTALERKPRIFAPVESPSEAVAMAGQATSLGLAPYWLGASSWHSRQFLAEAAGRMDGAELVTDYLPDPDRPAWKEFQARWRQSGWNEEPDRIAALGWDAVGWVLRSSTASLGFEGAFGKIQFDSSERFNQAVPALVVRKGAYQQKPSICEP